LKHFTGRGTGEDDSLVSSVCLQEQQLLTGAAWQQLATALAGLLQHCIGANQQHHP
jgi:hypothetical protein